MAGSQFLCGQIETFLRSWNAEKSAPIEQRELEARIDVGLSLYRCIRSMDERWSDAVRSHVAHVGDEAGKSLEGLYSCWLAAIEDVVGAVKQMEDAGIEVEKSEEFRRAFRSVRMALATDVAALEASYADLDAGKGIPFGEVVDEIHRRHVAKRI